MSRPLGLKKIGGQPWNVRRNWSRWEREYRVHVPWHAGAPDEGLYVKANLKKLISAVWVSPYAPTFNAIGLKVKAHRRPEPRLRSAACNGPEDKFNPP
jgi:hypothetical protein